jgi:hypothetical protein
MTKPLLITDCDEVLLHMVVPFSEWLDEEHGIDFAMQGGDFANALTDRKTAKTVEPARIWSLLGGFFDTEMHRQNPIAGAVNAITEISKVADVAILTNLMDDRREARTAQLAAFGIHHPVHTNQGPKGEALKRIVADYQPSVALFIDDLPQHHGSVSDIAPDTWRLHMIGEPQVAPHFDCAHIAGHAHARIDEWDAALPWILERLAQGEPASAPQSAAA